MNQIRSASALIVDPDPDDRGNLMVAAVVGRYGVMISLAFNVN